jgi:hypothetical protein
VIAAGYVLNTGEIAWWENTAGDGSAWTEHTVGSALDGPRSAFAANIDGDNDLDMVGAIYFDDDIIWWENTAGDGTAWTEHLVDGSFNAAESVFAADIDGDNDIDILGASSMSSDIVWWENTNGDGTAWTLHVVDNMFMGAQRVIAANIDGDDDLDVVGVGLLGADIAWWENTTGDGTSWTEHTVIDGYSGSYDVWAANVDGDDDLDILGAAEASDDISWWENTTGDGTSLTQHTISDAFDGAHAVHVADFDGDDDLDVVGGAYTADHIVWWENTAGDGSAWTAHTIDADFNGAESVYADDVDGDGDPDVIGAASVVDDIAWWENDCIP